MRISGFCLFVLVLVASSPARAGIVNGSVTLLENGHPAVGAHIALYQDTTPVTQVLLDQALIDASGTYSFSTPDLGQFRLITTLAGRISINQPFPGSVNPSTLNFALSLPSSITVTVRDAITLQPIQGAAVNFFSNAISLNSPVTTNASGIASLSGISGGSYVACVINAEDAYLNECNDNQHPPLGNAILGIAPLALNGGQNLALTLDLDTAGASVSGTLTNRYLGTPIAQSMTFTLFDVNGAQLDRAQIGADALGHYTIRGLAPGTFFLRASAIVGNYYSPRVFPDLNCASSCDVTLGTSITTTGNQSVTGIDFSLHPGSVITGRVTEAGSGTGLANVPIAVAGNLIFIGWGQLAQTTTAIDGSYTLAHIRPVVGTQQYRFGTQGVSTHINQSWPNIPCFEPGCFDGSTETLALDEVRNGIDFQLTPAGSFSGSVLDQTSALPLDALIFFQNESGSISSYLSHASTSPNYASPGLPPGTYFAYASRFSGPVEQCQVYLGLACGSPTPINIATATPIVITGTGVATGVDFTFDDAGLFKDGFEP